jgi:biopolymer transport protein ExbD
MMARRSRQTVADESGRYVSARKAREKQQGPAVMQPPLTPMIDVVFQLLLFFLLACTFRIDEGLIPANLPDLSGYTKPTAWVEPIQINVYPHPDPKVLDKAEFAIEGTKHRFDTAAGLYGYLVEFAEYEDPEKVPVVIRPTGKVCWDHVVNSFNQALVAGYKRIGLARSGS